MQNRFNMIKTDVLVIGSGGAGLYSAIKAAEKGVDVTIVTKGDLCSSSTFAAMGAVQAAIKFPDDPEVHFKDTVEGGAYLSNQKLVKIMVKEVFDRIKELEQFGTEFRRDEEGNYVLFPISGCTHPRALVSINPYDGGFIRGLINETKRLDVKVYENVMVTKLLKSNNRIVGAVAMDFKSQNPITFNSKSTIIATGGAGNLYQVTTNPINITGDGYSLAYDVGAELIDMEFIQFRACIIHPPGLRGTTLPLDGLVTIGGRFYNALHERYMKRYFPEKAERVTRDLIAIYAYREIKEGRGTVHGGVYNDLSGVPESELRQFKRFLNACKLAGINPRWQPIEWRPGAHHFMGGIRIDEKCGTNIPALYAAGEVTGGIHGANRIGGNALADVIVFGARAGSYAAENALKNTFHELPQIQIELELKRIDRLIRKDYDNHPQEVICLVQKVVDDNVSVLRNGAGLIKAIEKLNYIKVKIFPSLHIASDLQNLKMALEAENLVNVASIVANAALMRRESRGAHYRTDFPKRDDKNWLKNIVIRHVNGEMKLYTKPVEAIN